MVFNSILSIAIKKLACTHKKCEKQRQINVKIYAEVLAYCDFTFNGTNDRNSNKLALHDSCLSINLIFTGEYPAVDRSARIFGDI